MTRAATPMITTEPPTRRAVSGGTWSNISGILALFGVTLRRLCRGQRIWLGVLTAAVPILIVLLARSQGELPGDRADRTEAALVFGLMAQMLVPIMALWLASGLVQDEVEEQTLTYLLMRPVPRPLIYLTKLAAAILVSAAIASVSSILLQLTIHWDDPNRLTIALDRGGKLAGAFSLGLLAYNALFGLLGLAMKKPQGVGVIYIVVLEGVLANIDFIFRRFTILYYVRVLMLRWLGMDGKRFNVDASVAPSNAECIFTLIGIAAVLGVVGGIVFASREFRVKTPEAN